MVRRAVLLLLIVLPFCLGESNSRSEDLPLDRGVGRRVGDFTLSDTAGKKVRLYGYAGKKAVALVFLGSGCPVNDLYLPRLGELARQYESKGVAFVGIASNHGENAERLAAHAKRHGVAFPVLMDTGNVVADALLAERTCEVLLVDGRAMLRYRGAIDDQYTPTARKGKATRSFLVNALDAVLGGKEVAVKATQVEGCPLERREPPVKLANGPRVRARTPSHPASVGVSEPAIEVGSVTYATDVAPILQSKCQGCHRPGQVGPFSLLTFDDARKRIRAIAEAVEERRMPPWHADPRYGHFANDRSLSRRERAVLLTWCASGAAAGDLTKQPPPREFPGEWSIGKPDVVLRMPEPYLVAAQGTLPYQNFRVKTGFTDDTWIQAAEALPGDRTVVHHILVKVDDPKGRVQRDSYLAVYVPGDAPSVYPEGTAKLIPAGADLELQMHYTPIGRAKTDRSAVGLILAKTPPQRRIETVAIANGNFEIPAGHDHYLVESNGRVPDGARLLSFFPHMHLRGKSFEYAAIHPDGKREILLSVPAYDFGWQSSYRLATPRRLPAGTRIHCRAHFDNSAKNPVNPDPTRVVRPGEQTYEEMMIGFLDIEVGRDAQ